MEKLILSQGLAKQVDGPPYEDASGHLAMADRREIEKRGVGQWSRLASEEGKED